ncbi:hypothetical protein ACPXCE_11885 [Streptomyces sp. DT24]|uniref:hypothetical protein n=1 Tax=Streptomyces sp. DT24 TaxID=3416520 RepID=UPI003CEB87B4
MRRFPAPARWAAATAVTALTLAASTGCMSVGDDAGNPSPSRSADPKAAAAEPDGGTVSGVGHSRAGGSGAEAFSDRRHGASPSPGGSPSVSAAPGDPRPGAGPGAGGPTPTKGAPSPSASPSKPGRGGPAEPPPAETPAPPNPPGPDPEPEPDPEPSEPSPVPSASPAAQLRADAMRVPESFGSMTKPKASPQVGPV